MTPKIALAVATLQAEGLSVIVFSHRHPEPPLFYVAQRQGDPHFEAYLGRHNAFSRVVADLAAAPVPVLWHQLPSTCPPHPARPNAPAGRATSRSPCRCVLLPS